MDKSTTKTFNRAIYMQTYTKIHDNQLQNEPNKTTTGSIVHGIQISLSVDPSIYPNPFIANMMNFSCGDLFYFFSCFSWSIAETDNGDVVDS